MAPDRVRPRTVTPRRMRGDRGDVVLGWLTRVIVLLVGFGLMGFDAVSIGTGHFRAEDHAQQAARAAAESYHTGGDLQAAYVSALDEVAISGDTIDPTGFSISPDGVVTLTLVHQSPTLLAERVGFLEVYTSASRTVAAEPPR